MIADCVVLAELCDFDPFEKSYLRIQVVVQGLTHYLVTETSTEYKYTYKRQIKEIPELEIDSCVFCVNEYFTFRVGVSRPIGQNLEKVRTDTIIHLGSHQPTYCRPLGLSSNSVSVGVKRRPSVSPDTKFGMTSPDPLGSG